LQSRADDLSEDVVQARIVQALLDRSKIEYPVLLLKRQAAADLKDLEQRLQDAGVTYQQFLEAEGLTEEQHRERVAEAADRRVKTRLLLQELARVKELGVSDQEIDGEFQRLFADADPADKSVRRITQSDQQREQVANLVIQRKLRDCLKSIATIVDAPATPAE
jgi:trigger factor